MCPHHQNDFVATQALGHLMYVMYAELPHCIQKPIAKVPLYMFMYSFYYICKVLFQSFIIFVYVKMYNIHKYIIYNI